MKLIFLCLAWTVLGSYGALRGRTFDEPEQVQPRDSEDEDIFRLVPIFEREPLENVAIDSVLGKSMFAKLMLQDEDNNRPILLLRYLETQVNLGACAPASAVTVLNAMDYKKPIDPIYTSYLSDGFPFWTQTAFVFEPCVRKILGGHVYGETLQAFASVMKCLGLKTEIQHADLTENFGAGIREHLQAKHFVIANFERSLIHESAGGHFSPIAGYTDGYFLILDVARYKYPPVFVPCADLTAAMAKRDEQSGMTRGYVAVWK